MGAHCTVAQCVEAPPCKAKQKIIAVPTSGHGYKKSSSSWTPETVLDAFRQTHVIEIFASHPARFNCEVIEAYHRQVHWNTMKRPIIYKGKWSLEDILLNTKIISTTTKKTVGDAVFAARAWADDACPTTVPQISVTMKDHSLDFDLIDGLEIEDIERATAQGIQDTFSITAAKHESDENVEIMPLNP